MKKIIPYAEIVVTQELLDKHWHWADMGIRVGDKIQVDVCHVARMTPVSSTDDAPNKEEDENEDGPGGGQPEEPEEGNP